MDVTIEPHALAGTVPAVASKSMAHRLLVLAALCPGTTDVDCNTTSLDIEATVSCLESLGARISHTRRGFRVRPIPRDGSTPRPATKGDQVPILDCGESGSTLRFLLPVASALGVPVSIVGHGRLASRPLSPLREELVAHDAHISPEGSFPLSVEGPFSGGEFRIPGNVSSQYVSGLLMAAPLLGEPVRVAVIEPVESRSYITLTRAALAAFGVAVGVAHEDVAGVPCEVYTVEPGGLASPGSCTVEGDWSNSAFWLAAGAVGGPVRVTGLDPKSPQGDRAALAAASLFGARTSVSPDGVNAAAGPLQGQVASVADIPDLVPPLAAMAAYATGTTRLTDAGRLRLKESDRLATVSAAIVALGGSARVEGDDLVVEGSGRLSGGVVDAANDHRIAMMAAVCGAYADGPTTIRGAECVRKSYPDFFRDFRSLGGVAHESE